MPSRQVSLAALLVLGSLVSAPASAQGIVKGAEIGSRQGEAQGGAVGAIVGGAIGAATGAVNGILGVDNRPRVRDYVVRQGRLSYAWNGDLRVGAILPSDVVLYPVPSDMGADRYRYTVVNRHAVLVDPDNGTVIEVLD